MLQLRLSREERDQKEAAEQDIEDLKQVHILLHSEILQLRQRLPMCVAYSNCTTAAPPSCTCPRGAAQWQGLCRLTRHCQSLLRVQNGIRQATLTACCWALSHFWVQIWMGAESQNARCSRSERSAANPTRRS